MKARFPGRLVVPSMDGKAKAPGRECAERAPAEVMDEGDAAPPEPGSGSDLWQQTQRLMQERERPVTHGDLADLRRHINDDIARQFRDPVNRRSGLAPDNEFRGIEAMCEVMKAYTAEHFPPDRAKQMQRQLGRIRDDIHAGGDGQAFRVNAADARDRSLSLTARAEAQRGHHQDAARQQEAEASIKQRRRVMRKADALLDEKGV
jgi:hypothetical protein